MAAKYDTDNDGKLSDKENRPPQEKMENQRKNRQNESVRDHSKGQGRDNRVQGKANGQGNK